MPVTVTQQVPAFRMDDAALERLWCTLEAKCAEAGPTAGRLSVRETVRVAGRRTPEKHEHEYQSIDELRRASSGPVLLRNYRLNVSSPGDDGCRRVSFGAAGGGAAATVEASAPEAPWCREVVDSGPEARCRRSGCRPADPSRASGVERGSAPAGARRADGLLLDLYARRPRARPRPGPDVLRAERASVGHRWMPPRSWSCVGS